MIPLGSFLLDYMHSYVMELLGSSSLEAKEA